MDRDTVVAGCCTTRSRTRCVEDVERRFGPDVRALVDGSAYIKWCGELVLAEKRTHWSMRAQVEGETKGSKLPKLDATLAARRRRARPNKGIEQLGKPAADVRRHDHDCTGNHHQARR